MLEKKHFSGLMMESFDFFFFFLMESVFFFTLEIYYLKYINSLEINWSPGVPNVEQML